MKVVYAYVRVSTENQLENYSIEEQNARLKAYCIAKGWTLLHTYVDGGYSGGNTDRPALKQMLADLRHNKIDAVVVYKLDRLSRSQKDTLTLIEDEFLSVGTDFVSVNENFDTSTPFGRAMIGILSVFAQLEKDQITERFTMGRIGRGKAGYFHGGGNAPTGYDYVNGNLVVNEYEAMQVKEIFDAFLSGKSINAIMRDLSERYTTKWSAAKIANVLRNSIYIGRVKFSGIEYDGIHQPLISQEIYDSANQLFSSSTREETKRTAQKTPFRAGYLLSSLIYCGRCGARYSANHGYYKCYSRAKSTAKFIVDPNCKNNNWLIEDLDALVCQQVSRMVTSSAFLDAVLRSREKEKPIDKAKMCKDCAEIDKQMRKLIDLYQVDGIPMEAVTTRVKELSAQKEALERQMLTAVQPPAVDLFLSALESYKKGFWDGDTDQKRALLSSLIERITIDGPSVSVRWRL